MKKTIGLQIKGGEAILVVLKMQDDGTVIQTNECARFSIEDHTKPEQVRQFRNQINSAFDSIRPDSIAIVARNANGKGEMAPSPLSFKLEGIIQLYEDIPVTLVWKQTLSAFYKKKTKSIAPKHKYQQDAFDVAYYQIRK
ncbi:MAG: DUF3010 family protein [Chitinophagaceae bacterium]